MNNSNNRLIPWVAAIIVALVAPALYAKEAAPQTTPEGMELIKQTKERIVYAMPGATLDQYTRVAILDCYVAFKKDWERDYNRSASMGGRISDSDVERIKTELSAEFKKVFTEVLTEAGHEVVDHTGEDVLVLRPAIVDLVINAPDTNSASFGRVIVRSAGEMTLFLEFYDSLTSAIIARVIDAQTDDSAFAQRADRMTNKADADRIIKNWARELEGHLGDTRETTHVKDGD